MKNNDYTKLISELHAPSSAVEKALSNAKSQVNTLSELPPSTSPKKSVLRLSRRALLAASIVFVCALSVSVFFLFRNNPIPIAPSSTPGATLLPTETTAPTAAPASQQESRSTTASESPTQSPTQVSTDSEGHTIITITQIITPDGEDGPAEPSENQSPTQSSQKPTEKASEQPTQKPTSAPRTEEPQPTEAAYIDETTGDPNPAEAELIISNTLKVWTDVPDEILTKNSCVYCRIYDEYGTLLGDTDLFSSQHCADIDKNICYAVYDASEKRIELPEAGGLYTYVFYTVDGTDFTVGQIYVIYD